jgi:hypothetical protein
MKMTIDIKGTICKSLINGYTIDIGIKLGEASYVKISSISFCFFRSVSESERTGGDNVVNTVISILM